MEKQEKHNGHGNPCENLHSIALQEAALSHILNAEGEKIQKAVASSSSVCELIAVNQSVANTIEEVMFLELVLQKKLKLLLDCTSCLCEKALPHKDDSSKQPCACDNYCNREQPSPSNNSCDCESCKGEKVDSGCISGAILLKVRDDASYPLDGCFVSILNACGEIFAKGKTNCVGEYQTSLLPLGEYMFKIHFGRAFRSGFVIISKEQPFPNLNVCFDASEGASLQISGGVFNKNNLPVPCAKVSFHGINDLSTITDEDGRFCLTGLSVQSKFSFCIEAEGFKPFQHTYQKPFQRKYDFKIILS